MSLHKSFQAVCIGQSPQVDKLSRFFRHEVSQLGAQIHECPAHRLGVFLHVVIQGIHLLHGVSKQVTDDGA